MGELVWDNGYMKGLLSLLPCIPLVLCLSGCGSDDVSYRSEAISPNGQLKASVYNRNDAIEYRDWLYSLTDLESGQTKNLGECEGKRSYRFAVTGWKND